jgi:hypothetical protein
VIFPPYTEVQATRISPRLIEGADLSEVGLQVRIVEGKLVELEPQANMLTSGFDDRVSAHVLSHLDEMTEIYLRVLVNVQSA